jgi:autotransporter-associated beta strand protein
MSLTCLYRRLPRIARRLMVITLAVSAVQAQTWQSGSDSNWSTSTNWSPTAPANDGTAAIVFSSAGSTTSSVDTAWAIDSLVFDSTAQSYTISGETLTIGAGGITNNRTSGTQTISAPITLNSTSAFNVDVASGGALALEGLLTGTVGLTKTGNGTLELAPVGSFSYTGTLNLDAGTLTLLPANRATNGMLAGSTLHLNGGTFLNKAFKAAVGAISGSGNFATPRSISVGGNNASTIYSGIMSDTGGVTKEGSGTWTLTGANTYTGPTTVKAGTLLVDGSLASGNFSTVITVNSGGALGGRGTIGGPTTIQSGGTLAPGDSFGVLTFGGDLTLNTGSTSLFEIDGASRGSSYDAVDVAGTVTFDGTLSLIFSSTIEGGVTLDLFGGTGTLTGDFDQITASGSYSGSFISSDGVWTFIDGAQTLSFDASTGDLSFTGSAIPEPSTYAAFAGLAGFGFAFMRHRAARREQRSATLRSN